MYVKIKNFLIICYFQKMYVKSEAFIDRKIY